MKKIYTYISVFTLAVLALGCSKEVDIQDELPSSQAGNDALGETITITLSVPENEDTKTTLGSKTGSAYPVLWSANDVITLNGTAATSFTPASGNASATATFKLANLAAPYNFLYGGVAGHSDQVTFPSTQNYVANGFDPAAMPMYASLASRSDNVTFSHLAALLKFSITGSKKIDTVTLAAADENMSLSGNFTIGTTSGLLDGNLTPASGGANLIYSFGGHIQLSDTPFVFYIAVPAGTYEGGITLTIVDNASGSMAVKVLDANDTKTIAAGKVREFNTIAYVPEVEKNLIQIYDATTLNNFRTRVANGETTLNARVTCNAASFSASSIASEWVPIEDYKGIFEGNGKGITGLTKPMFGNLQGVVKNLTLNSTISATAADEYHWGIFAKQIIPSAEVDDIAGLQNCTAEGSITWTPGSAISSYMTLGGLVGNNRGGSITGCTNNATVTFASGGVTHTNQPSVGGVVGRTQKGGDLSTQGDISNCTNNGTVVCAAQFSQGAYIGGVLGYQVEKKENMSGCTNHGLVKVTSTFSTSGALHLGGVAGLAKGTLENCTNASDGVVTSEGCSVSSYLCQGGVVGRLNGTATYETLTNAGTLNVAALGGSSGRLIGGVVGRCQEGATLDGVTNSGNINYTATATNDTYIGGVVADNVQDNIILENCTSTGGTLTVSNASHSGALYVGGVVGYSTKAVTSCSNAMTIATSGSMTQGSNSYLCFGGVIGYISGAVLATSCTNSGAINFGQTQTSEGQLYIGGVAGALTGAEISGGGNSGAINFTGQNTKRPPSVGGIVGRVFSNTTDSGYSLNNNVTNSGSIVANSTVSSSQYMYLGGLVGQHLGGNIYGTNNAPITVTELHESMMALGGIVGYLAGGTVSNGTNTANGDIALNGYIAGYHSYVGGIAGMASGGSSIAAGGGTITGASNAGDVTVAAGCTIPRNNYVGGIIGYAGNDVSNASNTGNVVNNYSQGSGSNGTSYHMNIAGVAAHSVATLTSCTNTGNITNNGSTYKSEINVAGVVGISEGDLTSCSNGTNSLAGGTISNTATSGTNTIQDMQVGGVIGNNKGGNTITSCFNKGDVTNSGAGAKISMGGIAGWSSASTTYETTCYNMGTLTNTGTGSSNPGLCMGGLLGVARGANTLTGTASEYNYNKGLLRDDSATLKVAMGGVCGYSDTAASSFNYCQSQVPDGDDVDDIIIQNQTKDKIYVGGILGMSAVASSIDYTYSESDIWFSDLTMSATGQIFAGGIIGGWTASGTQTITGCTNKGWVYTASSGTSDLDDINVGETKTPLWSCFGGIAGMGASSSNEGLNGGWNTITGKTFTNCTNTGRIRIYCRIRFCIGGVVAYSENNISNCTCTADIYGYTNGGIGTVGSNYHRNIIGGVVGLFTGSTISSSKFQGTLNSYGSSPFAYDGGIIGYTYEYNSEGTSITLSGCKVGGGTIRGAGSGQGRCALMVNNSTNEVTYTFTDCVIKKSTVSYASGSKVTISSSDNVSEAQCFGGGSSSYTFNGTLPTVASSI
ncbi:MAG: hypothetical protein IKP46_02345 [Bacteroidales bacterium]|nr:hypothetical protein [Bacteroidales bacterium]